ncbi:MAG: cbb3-type cytochrome oxidase assembly protein [Gemmatimonadales bacterium]
MTAGMYIVAICAVGGLLASAAFVWALRSGQFSSSDEAKYLVFDDEDGPLVRPPARPSAPPRA